MLPGQVNVRVQILQIGVRPRRIRAVVDTDENFWRKLQGCYARQVDDDSDRAAEEKRQRRIVTIDRDGWRQIHTHIVENVRDLFIVRIANHKIR